MSEKRLIAAFTLIGSLASYYYSKANEKDAVPSTMIGGFIGAMVGEMVFNAINKTTE